MNCYSWVLSVWLIGLPLAAAQDPDHPLRPPDRSSPRAALKTFPGDADAGDWDR